jgi:hypothetical protein
MTFVLDTLGIAVAVHVKDVIARWAVVEMAGSMM